MKRFVVLGILFTAGAVSMSAAVLRQAPAAGGQSAPRVVEVDKLKDNPTPEGRIRIAVAPDNMSAAMIELQCESAPVGKSEDFFLTMRDIEDSDAMLTKAADVSEQPLTFGTTK